MKTAAALAEIARRTDSEAARRLFRRSACQPHESKNRLRQQTATHSQDGLLGCTQRATNLRRASTADCFDKRFVEWVYNSPMTFRLLGFILLLVSLGCANWSIPVPDNPHVYSGGEPAYLSPEEKFEKQWRLIEEGCEFVDLDIEADWGCCGRSDGNCRAAKIAAKRIKREMKRIKEAEKQLREEREAAPPDPGTIRFGKGPLRL